MINRIFKTILVLTICLGISIPTNAAVSVSDGSAFVTKAEFAADLNNLSNRMAQLENSLDAKIDSLVSSYLTRNGIWNGAKQDVNRTAVICAPKSITISSGRANGSYDYTEQRLVDNVNKSGMYSGYFSYVDPNTTGTEHNWFRWGYGGEMQGPLYGRAVLGANVLLIISDYTVGSTLPETRYSYVVFSLIGAPDSQVSNGLQFALYASIPWSTVSVPFQFFVSKGDRLVWNVVVNYHLSLITNISPDNNAYNEFKIWMEDGYVY